MENLCIRIDKEVKEWLDRMNMEERKDVYDNLRLWLLQYSKGNFDDELITKAELTEINEKLNELMKKINMEK